MSGCERIIYELLDALDFILSPSFAQCSAKNEKVHFFTFYGKANKKLLQVVAFFYVQAPQL